MSTRIIALGVVLMGLLGISRVASHDAQKQSLPERGERPTAAVSTGTPLEVAGALETSDLFAYLEGQERERQAVAAYLAGLEAERLARDAAAAEAARMAAARSAPGGAAPRGGACCGPYSDAWWRGVAICEQGGRNDPYYGYFSIMDGSAGGLDWDTQVRMANAIMARAGRESPTWAASCVAAGYRASPGG